MDLGRAFSPHPVIWTWGEIHQEGMKIDVLILETAVGPIAIAFPNKIAIKEFAKSAQTAASGLVVASGNDTLGKTQTEMGNG